MSKKADCPIWNYQASGLNWIFYKKIWEDSFPPTNNFKKIPEGIKLSIIGSIASVIEGSLRNYLISKVNEFQTSKKLIEKNLIDKSEDLLGYFSDFEKSKKELIKNPKLINKALNRISKEYILTLKKNKKTKFSICGWIYEFEFKLSSNIKKYDNEFFEKYIEIIKNDTWNGLIKHFELIKGERLRVSLKKADRKLMEDVEMIFHFRNFIGHSNNIGLEHNNDKLNYDGRVKKLIKYIDEKELSASEEKIFFIEKLVPDGLIHHFKKRCDKFLECDFFNEMYETSSLMNHIWTKD